MPLKDKRFTTSQFSKVVGLSKATIYRWIRNGLLHPGNYVHNTRPREPLHQFDWSHVERVRMVKEVARRVGTSHDIAARILDEKPPLDAKQLKDKISLALRDVKFKDYNHAREVRMRIRRLIANQVRYAVAQFEE